MLKLRSHSLASLCRHFSIVNTRAHRALEDAYATAEVLLRLLPMPGCKELIAEMTKGRAGIFKGPENLPEEKLKSLPERVGVYLFHDAQGKVVYVGKALNLRDRVYQHFSANTHTREKNQFLESVFDISFETCGHELMALLRENELIKKHYPRFNRLNKDFRLNHGIYSFEDQRGFRRLVVGESGKWSQPLKVFRSRAEAVQTLLRFSMNSGLCLHLNALTSVASPRCSYINEMGKTCLACEGFDAFSYNQAVEEALQKQFRMGKALLQMMGRSAGESGLIYLEKGKILGLGFLSDEILNRLDVSEIRSLLAPYYDTQDAQAILRPWLEQSIMEETFPDGTELFSLPAELNVQMPTQP